MIKHVVFFQVEKEAARQEVVTALNEMAPKVPHLITLEAGVNRESSASTYNVALITTHKSWEELDAYQKHPEHQKIKEFILERVSERAFIDFEI